MTTSTAAAASTAQPAPNQATAPAVDVEAVSKRYEGGVLALDAVTMQVAKGELMAIAGPSGSGKSTLLNIMGGLDAPSSGAVRIDGVDIVGMSKAALADLRRDKIGFVFQAYNLIPVLKASENAEYVLQLQGMPKAERRKRIVELFGRLGLGELVDAWPKKMSGGQQQRVAVARAIASTPAVVLADEPTANLDQGTGRALIELMRELNRERGVTFVLSTHDPMVLDQADRVVRLVDGRISSDERKQRAR